MKAVNRKLKSSRGASMIMALVFLLAALVLGAVALTAASANAGRTGRKVKEQQVYYALSSAAELIKEDMSAAGITATSYKTTVEQWQVDEFINSRTTTGSSFTIAPEGKLLYGMSTELRGFYSSAPIAYTTETEVIALSFSARGEMPQVQGSATFYKGNGEDYRVLFELYTLDGTQRSGQMTLSFAPYMDSSEDTSESTVNGVHTVTETTATTVSWGEPEVTKG